MMLAMGVLGDRMEATGIPVAPVVLGLVLGSILEQNFMVSMVKTDWDLAQSFTRPVAAGLGVATLLTWLGPVDPALLRRLRRA
jgi:putative tricarboxylic transport membrane protein